jgi:diaminohydroxyphosphoribosylaminopyrimidine deaminase/5-amino-6-(5-phosphoribosylamino)uracil reductase
MATTEIDDARWMRRALAEAWRGQGLVEPNPMVGAAVVTPDGRMAGIGHHARFGGPHAEVEALARAGDDARGATLYVTLEPCCHHGKTPPCTDAILKARIARVVAAYRDPFPKVDGGGIAVLREHGVNVSVGTLEADARRLNAPFLKRVATGRPFVIAKWAMTLDGKAACECGSSRWISGERSRAAVHELRGRMDAILAGIGTVLADDPALTARPPGPRTPLRVVLDPEALLPPDSQLARTARDVPVLVAATRRADGPRIDRLRSIGCQVVVFDQEDRVPIGPLLDELGNRGYANVLVEGGGTVLGAFLDANEVDAVEVFLAPILEGGDHARTPARGRGVALMTQAARLVHVETVRLGDDTHLSGLMPRPWLEPTGRLTGSRERTDFDVSIGS